MKKKKVFLGLSLIACGIAIASCGKKAAKDNSNDNNVVKDPDDQTEGQNTQKYTVNWVVDGQTIKTESLDKDASINAPSNPTKSSTIQYNFTFDGWYTAETGGTKVTNFGLVSQDVTYYGRFTENLNQYTYKFFNGNVELKSETVDYGSNIIAPENPTKDAIDNKVFYFDGWYTQAEGGEKVTTFATVAGDVSFYARFTEEEKYTYNFYNADGSIIKTDNILAGNNIVAPADPVKGNTAEYTYQFDGWYTALEGGEKVTTFGAISSNVSYYARYKATKNQYTYKFIIDGVDLASDTVDYGTKIDAPYVAKDATAEYTYEFDGWYTQAEGGEKVTDFTIVSDITVYARFKATKNQYTYSFIVGENTVSTATVDYGTEITVPADPTIAPTAEFTYTFDGWYTALQGGEKVTSFGTISKDVTYYARFIVDQNTYTYTLYNEDGSVYLTDTLEYGSTIPASNLTKDATAEYTYTFDGWYTQAEGGIKVTDFTLTSNVSLYARFSAVKNTYTYTLYNEDGTVYATDTLEYGSTIPAVDLSKATTDEFVYSFDGWYTQAEGGEEVTDFTLVGTTNLYARFTAIRRTYTCNFFVDGKVVSSTTGEYGKAINIPEDPTKDATQEFTYEFDCWTLADGTVVEPDTITGNVSLFARFKETKNKYTYTFYNADGNVYLSKEVEYGTAIQTPAENPTLTEEGKTYIFVGWYTAAEGGEKVTEFGNISDNVSFYAHFEEDNSAVTKYTYTFYDYDGSIIKQDIINENENIIAPTTTPTREQDNYNYYQFDGWYTAAENGEKVTEFGAITGNTSYYARYKENARKYSVVFYGPNGIAKAVTAGYQEDVTPPNVSKASTVEYTYTFDGWYTQAEGGEKVTDFTTLGESKYYARFTEVKNQYTYSFIVDGNSVSSATVDYGTQIPKPADPTKANTADYTYTFEGWYTQAEGGEKVEEFDVITGDVTYYARFISTQITYTYTLYNEDGTVYATDTLASGSTIQVQNPTKAATAEYTYAFDGWYTEAEGGIKVTDLTLTSNISLYARFTSTKNQYTYNFIVDGNSVSSATVDYGTQISKPADPTKASDSEYDYQFDGWYTAAEGGEKVTTFGSITGNVSYYAHFNAIAISGSEDPETESSIGFGVGLTPWSKLIELAGSSASTTDGKTTLGTSVSYNGFSFNSSKHRVDGEGDAAAYNSQSSSIVITVTSNCTLYVVGTWASDTAGTVSLAKGSTNVYTSSSYTKGADLSFSYVLTPGTYTISSQKSIKLTKLYKVVENVTVSFSSSHGTVPSMSVEKGATIDELPELYADGFVFLGWFTDANCSTPFINTTPITQNTTLYAGWKVYSADDYVTVVFNTGVGEAMTSRTIEKGSVLGELPELEAAGYRFDGWYTDSTFEHAYNPNVAINSSTTLYAKFIKVYDVSFKYEDNTLIKTVVVDENGYVDSLEIPSAEYKYGYTFAYWANGSTEFDFENTKITSNLTLTAKYVAAQNTGTINVITSGAELETLYAEFLAYDNATGYNAYVKLSSSSTYVKQDPQLIRKYKSSDNKYEYYRFDAVGIKAGTYDLKLVPVVSGNEVADAATVVSNLVVKAHERTGFGFVNGSSSGAYNDDGTLKSNAQVVYVSNSNKDTVTLTALDKKGVSTTLVGVQNIITNMKDNTKTAPLCIRFLGNITDPANMPNGDLYLDGVSNLTVEGIGTDATMNGFGIVIKNSSNVEIRNLGFMNCNSSEGDDCGLQQKNDHVWVHNCDFFYGDAGSDADQVKGDGALDTKTSTYITHSYNHFYDCGKCNLQGMKSESTEYYITYHHNWYDHSDSRHPRIRTCTVHIYNNYFDGNAKYGVGVTMGASAFVESNYFRSTATMKPMLSSMQGTDALGDGTFGGEAGGIIKAYNNTFDGNVSYIPYSQNNTSFDAYEVSSRNETVPSSVKTLSGGTTYNNFDTNSAMYSYTAQSPEDAKATVMQYAGRTQGGDFKWTFPNSEDSNYAVITALKSALTSYSSKLLSVQSIGEQSSGGQGGGSSSTETTGAEVNALIEALPNPSNVVEADRTQIMAAKDAYDALSAAEKANVTSTNVTKLNNCISALPVPSTFTIDFRTYTVTTGTNDVTFYEENNLVMTADKISGQDTSNGIKFDKNKTFTITNNNNSAKTFVLTVVGNGSDKNFIVDGTTTTFGKTATTITITIAAGSSKTVSTTSGGAYVTTIVVS